MNIAAIILAAGRGSRMKELTADTPKCLLELAGRPLLHWQLDALRKASVQRSLVVTGYQGQKLREHAAQWGFTTAENPDWARTNMLSTLLCADAFARECFSGDIAGIVVAYADIAYSHRHVCDLAARGADIAITFDRQWESLWRLRFGDPLLDAETFRQEGGFLREIGGKPRSLDDIQGQYMGLLYFSKHGWQTLRTVCADLGSKMDGTDMTTFLRELLTRHIPVATVPVAGQWCETDSASDREKYETALATGTWTHDWRS
ncbi:MAG: phosphocholine cytidylyltransferase family protein [Desulfovibrio sp.]|nr:phosphocholine cytidylyltransferase family protein [Desulfovibrio sp.]